MEQLRKEYYDARHVCFAYCLGSDGSLTRSYDAGEPKHSAGDPILGQIKSRELTNVMVVVVRYFGGTKLGIGGLTAAYKTTAAITLDQAGVITQQVSIPVSITYSYAHTNAVMKLVEDSEIQITTQTFNEGCMLQGSLPLRHKNLLSERVEKLNISGSNIEVYIHE